MPKIIWEKTYGGTNYEVLNCIHHSNDYNYLIGGSTRSSDGDIKSGFKGSNDIWVVKIDTIGKILWEKTYGGSEYDNLFDIQSTSDGCSILGGWTQSTNGDIKTINKGEIDMWVVKINTLGDILWEKTYGGSGADYLWKIVPTTDGGFLLGGSTSSSDGDVKSGNKGQDDIWLIKIDSFGRILWEKTYGGTLSEDLRCIKSTADGNFIFGGYTMSYDGDIKSENKGNGDMWLVKLDSKGKILWEKTYGGSNSEYLMEIQNSSNGGYVLGCYTSSSDGDVRSGFNGFLDMWIIKIDSIGNVIWERSYGGSKAEYLKSICLTSDGNYLLGGYTSSSDGNIKSGNNGIYDFWIVKINQDGNILWEKALGGTKSDLLNSLLPISDNGFILGGYTSSSDGDIKNGNKGLDDIWILKIKEEKETSTNIRELSTYSTNIFPNPTEGIFSVYSANFDKKGVQIIINNYCGEIIKIIHNYHNYELIG